MTKIRIIGDRSMAIPPMRSAGMARRSGPSIGSVSMRRNVSTLSSGLPGRHGEPAEDHAAEDDEHVQLQRDTEDFHGSGGVVGSSQS